MAKSNDLIKFEESIKLEEGYVESKNVIAGIKHDLDGLDEALDYYQKMANLVLKEDFSISAIFGHQEIGDFRRDKTAVGFTCYKDMLGEKFYKAAKANPHKIYKKFKLLNNKFTSIRIERDW